MSRDVLCLGYAVRFTPVDPADPSPALYLAAGDSDDFGAGRLTSCADDVWNCTYAEDTWAVGDAVMRRLARERLRADVVPLADALADLASEGQVRK